MGDAKDVQYARELDAAWRNSMDLIDPKNAFAEDGEEGIEIPLSKKNEEVKISKEIFSNIEAERLERRAAEFNSMRGGDTVENLLKQLRDAGWRVASHSDYETNGCLMTFWLFTHPKGEYVKGEASTDLGALRLCAIKAESFAKGW